MNSLMNKNWWASTAERAIKTFSQVALGFITVGVTGIMDVNWEQLVSVAGVATIASVLMRFSTLNEKDVPVQIVTRTETVEVKETPEAIAQRIENN